ncbi:uncharacterized protein BO80DRAFT_176892 [Aspergillus ibericus CBS 121593]|uniref:Transmembrane protein n=1 Tax=Aspergillus ibericus CBS 121593 TaxID=1448316 RepID=A0A395HDN4_9EURO|nr:hypothetical protein BO80DRAFT_176892 [Aspergillus ibericus CBS 121593]RAL05098.1 hypothetical protein BO80DRAFT_176892 [Aspergillus ibericus CBS 121593]
MAYRALLTWRCQPLSFKKFGGLRRQSSAACPQLFLVFSFLFFLTLVFFFPFPPFCPAFRASTGHPSWQLSKNPRQLQFHHVGLERRKVPVGSLSAGSISSVRKSERETCLGRE